MPMRLQTRKENGGRSRRLPPFIRLPNLRSRPVQLLWLLLCLAFCLAYSMVAAAQFGKVRRLQRVQAPVKTPGGRPQVRPPAAGAEKPDPAAIELLKKVLKPTAPYNGIQRTQVGLRMSEQKIEGDEKGRRRIAYIGPPALAGDIVLVAPNAFYYYHARANKIGMALWPIGQAEQRLRGLLVQIQNGRVSIARTGGERLLGRNCVILTIYARRPRVGSVLIQGKLWIDAASGVVLRNEQWSPKGQVSFSYMISVTIGPEAGVNPADFLPRSLPKDAIKEAVFPERQLPLNLGQAKLRAPFIMEPSKLPDGFAPDGVWVFGGALHPERAAVLLRYTRGVNHISLFERRVLKPQNGKLPLRPRIAGGNVLNWQATDAQGELVNLLYIGNLTPAEVQALQASMH